MNGHNSSKKEIVRRVLVYSLMTVTTLVLLVTLTMVVMGYRFNAKDYRVEQTGLVQFNSFPRGATIYVNGDSTRLTTTNKKTVSAGKYQFQMKLEGYTDWEKTLTIRSGTVTWLDYARMVPLHKQVTTVGQVSHIPEILSSPSRRFWLGSTISHSGLPTLSLIDFNNSQQPKIDEIALDVNLLSGVNDDYLVGDHQLTPVEWDTSSRYVILRHDYQLQADSAKMTEWLWLDRETIGGAVNLSTLTNLSLQAVSFMSGHELVVLQDNGDVRQLSVDTGSVSRPLLSAVKEISVFNGDTLAFVGQSDSEKVAGIWRKNWASPSLIMSVPLTSDQRLQIRVSKYFNKDTIVVSDGVRILVYRGQLTSYAEKDVRTMIADLTTSLSVNHQVDTISISPSGRFVTVVGQDLLTSYDLERDTTFRNISNNNGAQWLDNYYLWQVNSDGYVEIEEFDGANRHSLMPIDSQSSILLTADGKYIYGFLTNQEGVTELRRLSMTVS